MRILLLGATGLLGSEFRKIFEEKKLEFLAPTHRELDLMDFPAVTRLLAHERFSRIVYCVAYTHVDQAETERGACEMLNVKALENVLAYRQPIIYFSTDYIFDVPSGVEISEDTVRTPVNFYGETKARAEELLEQSEVDFWNIRTSWMFGAGGENFVTKILRKSKETDTLKIVSDEIGRPTFARDLAEFVTQHFIQKSQVLGHYHLQNSGEPTSWADFAEYFLRHEGWEGRIEKISGSDLIRAAKRPQNSVFKNTKLPAVLRDWHEATDEFLKMREK